MSEEGVFSDDSPNSIIQKDTKRRLYKSIFEIKENQGRNLNLAELVQIYEQITQNRDDDGQAFAILGHCYYILKDFHKCYAAYQKALYNLKDNRDSDLWYGIGCLYNKFRLYQFSEPAFQAVIKIDPAYPQNYIIYYKLGIIYKIHSSHQNAVEYLRKSLRGDHFSQQKRSEILQSIGEIQEAQGKLNEAIQTYEQAAQMKSANVQLLQRLGWAKFQLGEYTVALEKFQKALSLVQETNPIFPDLIYLIGRCFLEMKNFKEGQNSFQKAIIKRPHSYIAWCGIGVLYAMAGQHFDAYDSFVKATSIGVDKGEAWYNIGLLYERCNQKQEAILAYQRSLMLDSSIHQAEYRKSLLSRGSCPETGANFLNPQFQIGSESFLLKDEQQNQGGERIQETKRVNEQPAQQLPRISQLQQSQINPIQAPPMQPNQQNSDNSQQLLQLAQLLQLMQASFNGINLQQLLLLLQSALQQQSSGAQLYPTQNNHIPTHRQQIPNNQFQSYIPPQQNGQLTPHYQQPNQSLNQLNLQQIHQLQQLQTQLQAQHIPPQQLSYNNLSYTNFQNHQQNLRLETPQIHQLQQVKQQMTRHIPYETHQTIPQVQQNANDQQRQHNQLLNAMMLNNQVNQMRLLQAKMMQQGQCPIKQEEVNGAESAEALTKLAENSRLKRRGNYLTESLPIKKKK